MDSGEYSLSAHVHSKSCCYCCSNNARNVEIGTFTIVSPVPLSSKLFRLLLKHFESRLSVEGSGGSGPWDYGCGRTVYPEAP